jgi:hypothetical protein
MERHTAGPHQYGTVTTGASRRNGGPLPGLYIPHRAAKARDAEVAAQLAALRARLSGSGPVPALIPDSPPPDDGRCDECGYLLARCCCPGGPRGGAR